LKEGALHFSIVDSMVVDSNVQIAQMTRTAAKPRLLLLLLAHIFIRSARGR